MSEARLGINCSLAGYILVRRTIIKMTSALKVVCRPIIIDFNFLSRVNNNNAHDSQNTNKAIYTSAGRLEPPPPRLIASSPQFILQLPIFIPPRVVLYLRSCQNSYPRWSSGTSAVSVILPTSGTRVILQLRKVWIQKSVNLLKIWCRKSKICSRKSSILGNSKH